MTRINCVPVDELTDLHLRKEYQELPRMMSYFRNSKFSLNDIPREYCLGRGHIKFFYDKWEWLLYRYNSLVLRMKESGFKLTQGDRSEEIICFIKQEMSQSLKNVVYNDWEPSMKDLILNRLRIYNRIGRNPHLYKYNGEKINWIVVKEDMGK